MHLTRLSSPEYKSQDGIQYVHRRCCIIAQKLDFLGSQVARSSETAPGVRIIAQKLGGTLTALSLQFSLAARVSSLSKSGTFY